MKRKPSVPRDNWQQKVYNLGLTFHSDAKGQYWDESAYYEFSQEQVQKIEIASNEIYAMCLKAVERVIKDEELFKLFCSPPELREYVRKSWENKEPTLYPKKICNAEREFFYFIKIRKI